MSLPNGKMLSSYGKIFSSYGKVFSNNGKILVYLWECIFQLWEGYFPSAEWEKGRKKWGKKGTGENFPPETMKMLPPRHQEFLNKKTPLEYLRTWVPLWLFLRQVLTNLNLYNKIKT